MRTWKLLLGVWAAVAPLSAQVEPEVPLQRPEEEAVTNRQSDMLFDALLPVSQTAAGSSVWIWSGGRQVAMGTVVGDGRRVLTKWSEVAFSRGPLSVVGKDRQEATAQVVGVYEDDDLALLEIVEEDVSWLPAEWSDGPSPELGRFLVAATPEGMPLRSGVVSVAERAERASDQVLFGVYLEKSDDGKAVVIGKIEEDGGAEHAGLKIGDQLLTVDGAELHEPYDLKEMLAGHSPGDSVEVEYLRGTQKAKAEVILGDRTRFEEGIPQGRLRVMRAMGGQISVRGENFPVVIQSDMQLKREQCGGPIVDLNGKVVGISISRTDRTRTYLIPASRVKELLETEPASPELVTPLAQEGGGEEGRPRVEVVPVPQGAANSLRSHLEEMSEFIRRLEEEMEPFRR
ncbi:S1-C subfamily serine protease [Haloferula luteola]|uniref:S1-C subfamily serine protease n=1 Tax=Haloferula luteola TaxID=595692 RepID=A0A840V186_9BACT|nr:PDZ domain-containing protein [Haloferula luteola]MBB5351762.1 S1-C subfamily serine protease [Haloferula luteola]